MKLLFTLLVTLAFTASTSYCQSSFQDQPEISSTTSLRNKIKESSRIVSSQAKQITTDFIALSGYGEGGTTVEIPFRIILDNLDFEYGDSLSITFPEGFTILGVSNDDFFGPSYDNPDGTDGDPEPFNGIDGQTVSWGDNDNTYGGISTRATYEALGIFSGPYYHFTITVSIDESVSGSQTIDFHISGDGFGSDPGDLDGTITIDEGLSVAGIVCTSDDHNTLQEVIYEVGVMYGLGTFPDLTVFAPTDEAFEALPDGLLEELLADPDGALRDLLEYHGTQPVYLTENMFDGQEIVTGILETVTISIEGEDIYVNDALIIVENVEATNGVVQVIDAVLMHPEAVSPITLPLEFEFPTISYDYLGFQGAASMIFFNPDPSGINTSPRVMQSIKTEGAEHFAGTVVFLDEPIDFSESSSIHFHSWSPKADIPVRLRIENIDNSIGFELDVNTTDYRGYTALAWSAQLNCRPVVDVILSSGKDVQVMSWNGYSASDWASVSGHVSLAFHIRKRTQ